MPPLRWLFYGVNLMADMMIKQKLENVDIDVGNLGKAVNEKGIVNPRYGEAYPTLPSAIQIVIESGGFEPFATEAALKASVPVLKKKAAYALDTHRIFLWENGSWFDSGLSQMDIAKKFTENMVRAVKANLYNRVGGNILNVLDSENKLTMYLDQYSQLFLTGANKSVQQYLYDVESIKDTLSDEKKKNLVEFTDTTGGLYAYFSENAHLFLAELTQSVQAILNSDNLSAKSNQFVHDKKSVIANEVQPYLLSCLSGGGVIAPMPFSQAPHSFTPPEALINVKVTQGQRLTVDTVYRKDDGVVHPHILEFRNGFLGYRYILGLTPYYLTQDKYENPCIYGSHDLLNFELIDKFPQPFSERPIVELENQHAYNSDDFFTYDFYSGELIFGWRRSYDGTNSRNEIWGRRTKNGLDWTSEELIYDGKTLGGVLLSPSIIFNFETGLYELHIVEGTAGGWRIRRMTSPTLKNPRWTHSKYFQPIPNANIWHFEIRWVGNELFGLAHDDAMTGSDSSKNLYLCRYDKVSDEFVWSGKVLTGEHYDPYKATFVPVLNSVNNTIALQILWSSRSGGDENMWKLYSSKSNSIGL